MPAGVEAVATALLATCGVDARSPVRTRSPNALDNRVSEFLSEPAAEICRSSVSLRAASRVARSSNCALARLVASAVMSIPLPAPSVAMIELVADVVVAMPLRTAARGRT